VAVKLFILRHIIPFFKAANGMQMIDHKIYLAPAMYFKPGFTDNDECFLKDFFLYISLVNKSVYPATVEVAKYTASLSLNLFRTLMMFLFISL